LEQELAVIEQTLAWIDQEFGRSELARASLALIPPHPEMCFLSVSSLASPRPRSV
jgi:hypothetical protein